jgi:hypothetical protein
LTAVGRRTHLVLAGLVLVGAACDADAEEQSGGDPCVRSIERAARAAEISDQIEFLDSALLSCRSFTAYDAQLGRYPGIVGYDGLTYVSTRCAALVDDELVSESAVCTDIVAPTSSTLAGVPALEYVGQTLDGREVTIGPDDTEFVDGKPVAIVAIVDIAAEDGCTGVEAERVRWLAEANDPITGDEASIYAQHAENVLAFIGCEVPTSP